MEKDELVKETGIAPLKRNLLLLTIWLPFFVVLIVDTSSRIASTDQSLPPFSGQANSGRVANHVEHRISGDLVRLAGTPFISDRFPERTAMKVETNSAGFRDSEESLHLAPEVILCGASFADHGSHNSRTLTAILRRDCKVTIRNRCLAGEGPTASIIRYFTDEGVADPSTKVVIWCLVERITKKRTLRDLKVIDVAKSQSENRKRLKATRGKKNRKKSYLSRVETYFIETSESRKFLKDYSRFIPPTNLDRATDTLTALFELDGHADRPMVFYRTSLATHRKKFSKAELSTFLPDMLKMNQMAEASNRKLLIVLIPDKYTIYGDRAKSVLNEVEFRDLVPSTGRMELVEQALTENGVAVVNLRGPLREAANSTETNELIYHPDDTHWNDKAIKIAGSHIAKKLSSMLQR